MAVRNKSGKSVSSLESAAQLYFELEHLCCIEKLLKSIELLPDRSAMSYGLMASLSLLLLYCSLLGKLEK